MNIIEILKDDYHRFPVDQSYELYADNVYFKDPLNEFRGLKKYKMLIQFMGTWFQNIKMDLHDIAQDKNIIYMKWTLNWTTPVPWKPRIAIPGRSELTLDENQKIISHIDYWNCSRWDVVKQHIFPKR
jgi:hypothetical protein